MKFANNHTVKDTLQYMDNKFWFFHVACKKCLSITKECTNLKGVQSSSKRQDVVYDFVLLPKIPLRRQYFMQDMYHFVPDSMNGPSIVVD